MRFADIVGQEEVKAMLRRGVAEGRVSHAQLFAGESGYGTLPLALAYAQYLNCTDRHDGDSCGVCPACVKMAGLVHPDLHFVLPTNVTKSGSQKPLGDVFLPQWRELVAETGGYFDERMWYDRIGLDNQQGMIAKREADEVIRKKVMRAVTDTGPTEPNSPLSDGVANIFTIMEAVSSPDTIAYFREKYATCEIRYGDLKKQLAEDIIKVVAPIRERIEAIRNDESYLRRVVRDGAEKARESADRTVSEVRRIMGIRPF